MARTSSHPVLDSHGNRVKNLSYRETASGRVYERTIYVKVNGKSQPRRRPIGAVNAAEAIAQLELLEAKEIVLRHNRGGRAIRNLTLDGAATRYFEMTEAFIERIETEGIPEDYKGLTSIDTLATYRGNYEKRIKPFFGNGRIACSDVTTLLCQDFFAHLRQQPGRTGPTLAEGTINSVKSALSAILEEARVAGALDTDPLAGLPKRDRPKSKPRKSYPKTAVRPEVLFAIYDNAPVGYRRALVALAVFSGMRSSEITALKWEDIRFEDEAPHIWIAWALTRARKRKPTKTGTVRPFPLNPEMTEALQGHREKERERGLGGEDDYIFTHPRRREFFGEPMGGGVVLDAVVKACEGLPLIDSKGVPITTFDVRAARRSVATWLENMPDLPRSTAAGQMGHSVETADRVYVQKHHDSREIEMVGLAIRRPPTLTVIEGGKEATA
jgi:integrase